jgi:hypothetical protein
MNKCKFSLAWIGDCKQPCDNQYCTKHLGVLCSCGNQADRECSSTIGSMVCGEPMCSECHEVDLGRTHRHMRKNAPNPLPSIQTEEKDYDVDEISTLLLNQFKKCFVWETPQNMSITFRYNDGILANAVIKYDVEKY